MFGRVVTLSPALPRFRCLPRSRAARCVRGRGPDVCADEEPEPAHALPALVGARGDDQGHCAAPDVLLQGSLGAEDAPLEVLVRDVVVQRPHGGVPVDRQECRRLQAPVLPARRLRHRARCALPDTAACRLGERRQEASKCARALVELRSHAVARPQGGQHAVLAAELGVVGAPDDVGGRAEHPHEERKHGRAVRVQHVAVDAGPSAGGVAEVPPLGVRAVA